SAATVTNSEAGKPGVEVNVVAPIRRKGYRFKGRAEVHGGRRFDEILRWYATERGSDTSRVKSVVLVRVEQAASLVSPAYADGSSEATIEQRSLDMYAFMRTPREQLVGGRC